MGLKVAEEVGMKAFRSTVPAGSLCFIPAGFVCVERTLGGQLVSGWRAHCIEGAHVADAFNELLPALRASGSAKVVDIIEQTKGCINKHTGKS